MVKQGEKQSHHLQIMNNDFILILLLSLSKTEIGSM